MNDSADHDPVAAQERFRRTLTQVLIVQIVALTLLGMLQFFYNA